MAIEVEGGGGGVFVPSFISGNQIVAFGATGTLFQLTPPSSQRVCLYKLDVDATAMDSFITELDGSKQGVIISEMLTSDTRVLGSFSIGTYLSNNEPGSLPFVIFEVDEVVTVSTSATTNYYTFYQYAFGSIK